MITKTKELFNKIYKWYLRRKARLTLIRRYEYLVEVNNLMEEFDTERILNFDEKERRNDLLKVQQESKGMNTMISFLKNIK
jgi:hypothetical protein